MEEQKEFNAQLSQKIHTVENPLEQKLDGFQSEVGQQFDSLQCSISKLAQHLDHQGEENPEDQCLTETVLGEQAQLQPQEELKVESVEAPEELQDALELSVAFWPWKNEEAISPLLIEEAVEEHQEYNLPLPPTGSVYILPSPASQSQHKTPEAPSIKATPSLPILQNLKKLMAIAQIVVTTSKKVAAAYIAWDSGWFGCRFGFGAPEPRHF